MGVNDVQTKTLTEFSDEEKIKQQLQQIMLEFATTTATIIRSLQQQKT